MDDSNQKPVLAGLSLALVKAGFIDEATALASYDRAQKDQVSLVHYLYIKQLVGARDLAITASTEFGLPILDLDAYNLEYMPVDLVKPELLRQYKVLPLLKRGNRLFLGLSDPGSHQALEEIKHQTRLLIETVIVEIDKLNVVIDKILSEQETLALGDIEGVDLSELEFASDSGDEKSSDTVAAAADDAPIVRFVNKVIVDAITQGASDIHFEPYEKEFRIRFRQDGILYENIKPPVNLAARVTSRIKVISHLDISERRIPQDGRFKMRLSKSRSIDFRVSTCPTLFGEKVVMRILDPTSAQLGIESLGYDDHQRKLFMTALEKPQGLILVTGPTGSGKTVSLYTALNVLNVIDVNISTCEDPVEINLPGINQVNVNPKAGLTFATALRAFLRQDPDVIMVGEIRDLETAEISIKAAQTGHLVLSTLHTNSAADTLNRLINMGIPAYNLATAVTLIIAQRLARKLCISCKVPVEYPKETLVSLGFKPDELEGATFFEAKGCQFCKEGYKGRLGIYEVMPINEELSRMVLAGANALDIAMKAEAQGVWSLRYSALQKFKVGLTSLAEINRVTKD